MEDVNEEIGRELDEAQAAMPLIREIQLRRQKAVKRALDAGWTKYRIAARLGAKGTTVDAIIKSIERSES